MLYWAGTPGLLIEAPSVSVVGSRRPSEAGLRRARRLVKYLVEQGVTVVSGLAQGIDTCAHRTAIEGGGRTIAVLGTPLEEYFPRQNRALQEQIMREHLAISQFLAGTPGGRGNFPQRNRTMALISNATVIVEAGESSGTLHQGWEALRLNRPLFLLRSLVENPTLKWPKKMLEYGAITLSEPEGVDLHIPPPATDLRATFAI